MLNTLVSVTNKKYLIIRSMNLFKIIQGVLISPCWGKCIQRNCTIDSQDEIRVHQRPFCMQGYYLKFMNGITHSSIILSFVSVQQNIFILQRCKHKIHCAFSEYTIHFYTQWDIYFREYNISLHWYKSVPCPMYFITLKYSILKLRKWYQNGYILSGSKMYKSGSSLRHIVF